MKFILKNIFLFVLTFGLGMALSSEAVAQTLTSGSQTMEKSQDSNIEKVLISEKKSAVIQLKRSARKSSYLVYTGYYPKESSQPKRPLSECDGCVSWKKVEGGLLTDQRTDRNQPQATLTDCYPKADLLKVVVMTNCDGCVTVTFKDCKKED